MDPDTVRTLRWPREEPARQSLRRSGLPCLLLVAAESPPPVVEGLEDWVRMPAAETDVAARREALARRATAEGREATVTLEEGLLSVGDRWVVLPPVQAALAEVLLERRGTVVSRSALCRSAWPRHEPDRNTLDVHIGRLRRSLDRVGLSIVTVRSRGYLLRAVPTADVRPQPEPID